MNDSWSATSKLRILIHFLCNKICNYCKCLSIDSLFIWKLISFIFTYAPILSIIPSYLDKETTWPWSFLARLAISWLIIYKVYNYCNCLSINSPFIWRLIIFTLAYALTFHHSQLSWQGDDIALTIFSLLGHFLIDQFIKFIPIVKLMFVNQFSIYLGTHYFHLYLSSYFPSFPVILTRTQHCLDRS